MSHPRSAEIVERITGHLPVFARGDVGRLIAAVRDETIAQIAECRAVTTLGPRLSYCATCGHHQRTDRACSVAAMQEWPKPSERFGQYLEDAGDLMATETRPGKTRPASHWIEAAAGLEAALFAHAADGIAAEEAE